MVDFSTMPAGATVDDFVRAAVDCSVFVSPRDYGLTDDELEEVARRAGFKQGETRDAIGRAWRIRRLGQKRLMPQQNARVLDGDFNFVYQPDYRDAEAFEFVRTDLFELAREVGEKAAVRSRDEIVERGTAAGRKPHDLDVAISILLHAGILEEKDGRVGHAPNRLHWPLPSKQIASQSSVRVPTFPLPAIEQAFPIVKAVMQLRESGGVPRAATVVAADAKPVVRGVVDPKEKPLMADVPDKKKVFIIHGRNTAARVAVEHFLKALKLEAVDFDQLAADMPSEFVGNIVLEGLKRAHGIVSLFTPDEWAVLWPPLRGTSTGAEILRWQSRPNVLFEAGIAFGTARSRTVLVTLGPDVSLFSDVSGIHLVRLNNSVESRNKFRQKLIGAGCDIDLRADAYTDPARAGDFDAAVAGLAGVSPPDPFRSGP